MGFRLFDHRTETINSKCSGLMLTAVCLFVAVGALQNTAITRILSEDNSTNHAVGFTALYFAGMLLGAWVAPYIIRKLGHHQTLVSTSIATTIAMVFFTVSSSLVPWGITQTITGLCIACQYIAVESWLNIVGNNKYRARLLGLYMLFWYLGASIGPLLLPFAEQFSLNPFIISQLLSILTVGIFAKNKISIPLEHNPDHPTIRRLFLLNSSGIIATVIVGVSYSAIFGLTAAYAHGLGYNQKSATIFAFAFVLAGGATQYPLGYLSDRFGRQIVLTFCALFSVISATLLINSTGFLQHCLSAGLIGAFSLPIYALATAQVQEVVPQRHRTATAGKLFLLNSIGSFAGPSIVAVTNQWLKTDTLFIVLATAFLFLTVWNIFVMVYGVGNRPKPKII